MILEISWILPYIPIILSIVNLLVLAYNIKLNRDTLGLKRWVEMLQHSNLLIKLEGITALQIGLTNVGEVPIDRIEVEVKGSIEASNQAFHRRYTSKSVLSPKSISNIPLFKELRQYLIDQKKLQIKHVEVPSGEQDIMTGENIFITQENEHIVKPFTMRFVLDTTFTIHQATKKIPKEFLVSYEFIPEYGDPTVSGDPECRYCDNFKVEIEEVQWASSS